MSHNKKYLAAGTNQKNCKLILWDILSKSCLMNMQLMDCIYIYQIKFAYDNRQVMLIAVTEDYKQILYLIDSKNQSI